MATFARHAAAALVVAAAALGGVEADLPNCRKPYSVLCPMLDYESPDAKVNDIQDVGVETPKGLELEAVTAYLSLETSKDCRMRYRELTCRLLYPRCMPNEQPPVLPCRSVCQKYQHDCDKAFRCDAFPASDNCYESFK